MKKIAVLLIGVFLLACTCSAPTLTLPLPTSTLSILPDRIESPVSTPPLESNLTLVRLSPRDGSLTGQLHAAAPQVAALGQRMFVEFDAEWCPSCKVITLGLEQQKSEALLAAFDGVYLIRLDVDEWGWGVPEAGFEFEGIPVFFRLDENGDPTGDWIDGSAWGPDTYENIARVMGPWLHQP